MRTTLRSAIALLIVASTACGTGAASSATRSGISGVVQAGPTCPVERPESPCPDRPVAGAKITAKNGPTVGRTKSDETGHYKLRLKPGMYIVTASSDRVFGCDTTQAKVVKHEYTNVTITCDTGIR